MEDRAEINKKILIQERIISKLDEQLEKIIGIAQIIIDNYWHEVLPINSDKLPYERTFLGPRYKRTKTGVDQIMWNLYNKRSVNRQSISKHICKGRGAKHSRKSLASNTKAWNLDRVLAAEDKLAVCRIKIKEIKKARRRSRGELKKLRKQITD